MLHVPRQLVSNDMTDGLTLSINNGHGRTNGDGLRRNQASLVERLGGETKLLIPGGEIPLLQQPGKNTG